MAAAARAAAARTASRQISSGSTCLVLHGRPGLLAVARGMSSSSDGGGKGGGVFKDFVNKVKEEMDKDASLKESVASLKEQAEALKGKTAGLNERVKAYQEGAKSQSTGAAEKLAEQQQQLREQASKVGQQASEAAKQFKEAFGSSFLGDMKGFAASKETPSDQQQQQQAEGSQASETTGAGSSAGAGAGAGSGAGATGRAGGWMSALRKEVAEVFAPPEEVSSATFRPPVSAASEANESGTTELVAVKAEKSAWERRFGTLKEQVGQTPLFQQLYSQVEKVRESPAGKKVTEQASRVRERVSSMKEDMQEKWETSDSAVVHGIQNMQDSMFAETERAASMRVIRQRDQHFDMVKFLLGVRADIPAVLRAYLTGDAETLSKHCSKEMVERLTGQYKFMTQDGQVIDSTILDTGEIELVDVKVLEGHPLVVVRFSVQQINCARDKFGNVTEGAPDDVQRVYYLWALQQEEAGLVDEAGKYWPPRWQLREMLVQGMHNLI